MIASEQQWIQAVACGPNAGAAFGKAGELFVLAGGCGFRNGQLWERRPDGSRPGKSYFDEVTLFVQEGARLKPVRSLRLAIPLAYAACGSAGANFYILGGEGADGKALAQVSTVDDTGAVRAAAWSLPNPRKLAGFCPLTDGRLAIGGGDDGSGNLKSVLLCDLSSGEFETLPEIPGPARILPLLLEGEHGLLLAGGRYEGGGRIDIHVDAWLYRWSSRSWEPAVLPRPMMAPCASRLDNGEWLVFPGDDGAGLFERLDYGKRGGAARASGDIEAARPLEAKADALLRDHPGFPRQAYLWDSRGESWHGPVALPFPAPATSGCAVVSEGVVFLAPGEPGPGRRMEGIMAFS
ncbi:MAG: hypothetical protein RL095_1906 [Verrucomicrobiota bacterium]|jgi:hypothetical protein